MFDSKLAIQTRNLNFSYSDKKDALNNINLNIFSGEKVAVIGPNGAGKSTLLMQFNGILRGNGEILINDLLLTDKSLTEIRRRVGVVFQDPNDQLFCPTVFDDVAFGPMHFKLPKSEISNIVSCVLKDVGLSGFEKKSSHHLSLGEKKRVAIATVLASKPNILLLDEPSANMDPKHRRELIKMINNWNYTTVITTHDLDLAQKTCSRCIILNKGLIAADGPCHKILGNNSLLESNELI